MPDRDQPALTAEIQRVAVTVHPAQWDAVRDLGYRSGRISTSAIVTAALERLLAAPDDERQAVLHRAGEVQAMRRSRRR